jgi:hypothetical protein
MVEVPMARSSVVAALFLALGLATLAAAQPPRPARTPHQARTVAPAAGSAPVIARVRTRRGVLELTRDSIAAGGAAEELRDGVARLIADAAPTRASR